MTTLQEGHPLTDYVRRSEKEILRFLNENHVEMDYDNFIRVGLPLLHGVMKEEIHPGHWIKYCGGENLEMHVMQGDKVYIKIPPLHAPQPTLTTNDPEFPGFSSQHAELSLNRQDNPDSFDSMIQELISMRLPDTGVDDTFIDQINYVFSENGFATFDKTLVNGSKAVVSSTTEVKVEVKNEDQRVDGDLI